MAKQIWQGASGATYEYEILSFNGNWNDVPGNYIFAKQVSNGWQPIHIGETDSLRRPTYPIGSIPPCNKE